MAFTVSVAVDAPPEAVFGYLTDPRRRPEWQSSLRRVDDVTGSGARGTTWTDVLVAGPRARMEVTVSEPFRVWTERGSWRGIAMDLTLRFRPVGDGTRLSATVALQTPRLLRPLAAGFALVGPRAVRADLARAGRLVQGTLA